MKNYPRVRPSIAALKPYSSARDEFDVDGDFIFMDANENPFNTKVNRYPDPYQSRLKNKWAPLRKVSEDQIIFGNGSDELIELILKVFVEPREQSILCMNPSYSMYKVSAAIHDCKIALVDVDANFDIDMDKIIKATQAQTSVIFLCSPNNPTGRAIPLADIKVLLEEFDGLVVVDQAYINFSERYSALELIKEYNNLMVLETFSKGIGMAGIRLGVGYANPELIAIFNKVKPPYNINELTQAYALQGLDNYQLIQKQIKEILEQREKLFKALVKIPCIVQVFPSEANFILIRVDDAELRYKQLLQHGIIVRLRNKELHCENCLRISIGTSEENQQLIKTLKTLK
ncbi:MAG: histidinol-phosphate transaminase [Flavobacteriaceae bacterium]